MEEKRKPYLTISFRQPRLSRAILAMMLTLGLIVGVFCIQEFQRWQTKMLASEARLHDTETDLTETEYRLQITETRLNETEAKLRETEAELLEAKKQLETYLPISQLNEPVAFISTKWGIDAITCTRLPQGYLAWGDDDGEGRLFYYYAKEWDTVEAIDQSHQYKLVGEDQWSANWEEEEDGIESYSYYMHIAVLELHPFTWSKSKDWISNGDSWEDRLNDYCREAFHP